MATPGFAVAAIGLNHGHIYEQTRAMLEAGCRLKSFFAPEDDLAAAYGAAFPQAQRASGEREILEDGEVRLILGAGIPADRAPMAVRAMRAGKDVMLDKPGATSLDQLAELRRVQAETGRILSIYYTEHYGQRATVEAGRLVEAGAIGRVIQTIGLGPHRLGPIRPPWFYRRERTGGILADIASHQVEQFLFFTGSTRAEVLSSQVANFDHPDHPELEDFGQILLRGAGGATGTIRVDWFTPEKLPTWGDGRLFLLGTAGTIELRKYVDVAGRPGGDHLFLVNGDGVRHVDCSALPLPYGGALRDDVLNRTETAMPQAHCFYATELALEAQARATRLTDADRPGAGA